MTGDLRWRRYGERGVLVELDTIDEVHRLRTAVEASGIAAASVPGASTLYVEAADDGDGLADVADVAGLARSIGELELGDVNLVDPCLHEIDVVYDGVDLDDVSDLTGLAPAEVIERHTAAIYTLAFLGFSRSFPYLTGLDPALVVPRLATPRARVPAGSVAIAGEFTGIYPAASPGGWRLLGRTERCLFDPSIDPPSFLGLGDHVVFRAVRR